MNRYKPTQDEIAVLKAKGWRMDNEGWWYPSDKLGRARTYREAVKEQAQNEKIGWRNDNR